MRILVSVTWPACCVRRSMWIHWNVCVLSSWLWIAWAQSHHCIDYWYQLLTAHCCIGRCDMCRCSFPLITSNRMPGHGDALNIRFLLTMLWWSRVCNHKCHSELNRDVILSDTLLVSQTAERLLRFNLFTAAKQNELMKTAPAISGQCGSGDPHISPILSSF